MDGQTDRLTDERVDRRTYTWTVGTEGWFSDDHKYTHMYGRMSGRMSGRIDGRT